MAATRVKVWNENKVELVEEFKGEVIKIPAGKYIEMGRSQAVQFKGQYRPPKLNGMKQQTPESMKIIRIEPIKKGEASAKARHQCSLCDRDFPTKQGLTMHVKKAHEDAVPLKEE